MLAIAIPVTLYLGSPLAAMVAISICTVGIMCALPTFWALPPALLTGVAAGTAGAALALPDVALFPSPPELPIVDVRAAMEEPLHVIVDAVWIVEAK